MVMQKIIKGITRSLLGLIGFTFSKHSRVTNTCTRVIPCMRLDHSHAAFVILLGLLLFLHHQKSLDPLVHWVFRRH